MTKATPAQGGIIEQVLLALYSAQDTVSAIDLILALLGEAFDVSRAYIFEDSVDGAWCCNTFEWCAPGVAPQKETLQHYGYTFTNGQNDYYRMFDANGVFYCPDISTLPEAEQETLRPQQVRSMLQCALMDGGEKRGFIGFDECRSRCTWPEKQVETLCLVSKIVGVFLLKARSEAEASFSSDFRAALDNSASYVYIVDPATYEILHCNHKIRQHSGVKAGKRCYAAFMGLDKPCDACPIAELNRAGEPVSVEMLRPDGLWLVSQASPMRWHGRRMMMVTCVDITRQKQAEVDLREREDENAIVVRQSGKYILRYDVKARLAQNYADVATMFNIPQVMDDYPESLFSLGIVEPSSIEPFRSFFESMRGGVPTGALNMQLRLASGQYRWFHADYTLVGAASGKPTHAVVSFSDCTEQLEKELAYEKLQNDLSVLIEEGVSFLEGNLTKDTVERIEGLCGKGIAITSGETFLSRLLADDCERNVALDDRQRFTEFYDQQRLLSLCARNVFRDSIDFRSFVTGENRWYHSDVQLARYPYTNDVKIFIVLTDVTERHRERAHLEELAFRDSMTRLLNRDTTESRVRAALAACAPEDTSALFMIDLDNFKQVNDTRGHQAGDEALRNIARAIAEVFREEDVVGRIGGDEFIAFVARGASRQLVSRKAAALVEELQFSVGDLVVTASIGVSIGVGGSKSFDQLYSEADKALYGAKRRGKSQFSVSSSADGPIPAPADPEASAAIQFKSLLENIDGGIVLANVGENIQFTYVSPSFFRSMGRSEAEAGKSGEKLNELVLPEDLPMVRAAIRRAAAGEVTDCVYRVRGAQESWWQLRIARITAAAGQAGVPVIGVITDITELKRTETSLRVAEERYRLAMQQTGGMIWEVDIPAHTLYQAEMVSEAFGQTGTVFPDAPESVLRLGVIHPDSAEEYRRIFDDIYAGREGKKYTLLVGSEAVGYFWTRVSYLLMRDDAGVPYRAVGVSEKLTNVEPEMRIFNGELRFFDLTAPSLFGAVYANLSQNKIEKCTLPKPNGDIASYEELYALREKCIAPEDVSAVSSVMSRDSLLAAFQNGQTWLFAEYRRKMPGDSGVHWINVSANLLRHPVSGDLFAFLFFRDITMRRSWEFSLSADTSIERDSATVLYTRETLSAMARAAIEQTPAGSRCFMTVFTLSGFEKLRAEQGLQSVQRLLFTLGRLFRIVVEGTVVAGVLDETHFCIFRVGELSTEQHRDSVERCRERILMLLGQTMPWLSLTILCGFTVAEKAHAAFERMVHQASVASDASLHRPGLPVTLYADPNAAPAPNPVLPSGTAAERRRILVADDDPTTRRLLQKVFCSSYAVDTASDGQEVLDMLPTADYAIVITDIHMPKMSGWEVLETIKADRTLSGIPVVIITSDTDEESEVKALTLGAEDVIVKPFMPKTMQSRVANIIGRYESARTSEQNRLYELRFQQQAYLLRLAEHDELTGLYNRQAFYRRVRARLDEKRGVRHMILRWDIDNFKMLNDAMGVETGDRLLIDIARHMRERCGKHSIYARIEADHFVDFFPVGLRSPEDVFGEVARWFASYPLDFKITVRMGVFYVDEPEMDVRIMCDRALLALRSVKGSFSSRIGYYDDALRNSMLKEQALSAEMVPALRDGQFRVYFQPQYNYDTGEMVGAEALVRWAHPTRGLLPPGVFVPLFERNGFIASLDEYVWEESCRYMRRWLDQEQKCLPVSVSVNISRIDIYNPHLTEKLLALVKKYRLSPSMLRLEITESAYMQIPDQLIAMVRSLQSLGFTVEMDDFGVGYSALATLKDVPVDILKLDMRFLSSGADDARGGNLLSSVIRMARWLKLPIIAEGVETAAQAEYLKSLNCFYMQGYFFGKPMSAESFEALLHSVRIGATDRYRNVNIEGMAAFWDPAAQSALLFNSFLGGAAIAEYQNGAVEIVRTNDRFFEAIGVPRAAYVEHVTRVLEDILPDSRTRLLETLETAIRTGKACECEVAFHIPDGSEHGRFRCIRTIARLLAQNGASDLFFLAVEDVTERRLSERREQAQADKLRMMLRTARAEEERDRLVTQYLDALIFDYDFDADTLSYEFHQPGKGAVSRTIRRYLEYLPGSTVVHPDFISAYHEVYREAQKAPVHGDLEYIADNFGAGFRWCRGHYASIADESGHVYRMVGIVCDIQQEKDREQRKAKA